MPDPLTLKTLLLAFFCFSLSLGTPQATMLFAELTYTLATEEAERIGVDHVARMTATGSGENSTGNEGWRSSFSSWGGNYCHVLFQPWPLPVSLQWLNT